MFLGPLPGFEESGFRPDECLKEGGRSPWIAAGSFLCQDAPFTFHGQMAGEDKDKKLALRPSSCLDVN